MPRPPQNIFRKYFNYNSISNSSFCLVKENEKVCGKEVKGNHGTNLASHVKHTHKKIYESDCKLNVSFQSDQKKKSAPISNKKINEMFESTIVVKMTKEEVIDACVELCSVNGRPFAMMEDSGFRKIIDPLLKSIKNCSINQHNIKEAVLLKATSVRENISSEVFGKLVCLKMDCLTHLGRSFLGVNIQFIKNGKIQLRSLAIEELFENHTGAYLKEKTLEVLSKFKISLEQIYTCTTDNGSNMIKCVEMFNDTDEDEDEDNQDEFFSKMENISLARNCVGIRCAAHSLQLVVNVALNESSLLKILETARGVVKKLRSPTVSVLLKKQNLSKPPIDCLTRWSSLFKMIEALIEPRLLEFCNTMALVNNGLHLDSRTWNKLKEVYQTLQVFHKATIALQSEQLTVGDFYGQWVACKLETKKHKSKLARKLLEEMETREEVLFSNPAFLCGILFDPRWNVSLSASQSGEAIDAAIQIFERKSFIENIASPEISLDMDDGLSPPDEIEAFLKSLDHPMHNEIGSQKQKKNLERLRSFICMFLKEKRVDRKENILQWWENRSSENSMLFEIAQIALGVPPTQVSVERLFSGAKFIMNPQRNRLDTETFESIMLIRSNEHFARTKK